MKRLLRCVLLIACVNALLIPGANAEDIKIRLMVAGIEKQIYLPVKLAEQLGYFREEGLNVELLSEPSGVNAEDELLAGAVQGVVGFYDHTIYLQARGRAVQSVIQLMLVPGEIVLVSSAMNEKIRSPADFRGKTLGVTGLGSSTHFLTQYLAQSNGVKANEYKILPAGSGNTFIDALNAGKIDAGMTTEPTASRLISNGDARILIDLRSAEETQRIFGGPYPAASLYMQAAWIDGHRLQVQKLVNALVRSLKYIQTHTAAEIATVVPESYFAGDRNAYIKTLAASKAMYATDGLMPDAGPPTVLKMLSLISAAVRRQTINLAKTFTTEFVEAAK